MLRILLFAIELVLLIFCLVDCIQTDQHRVRNLPKLAWIIIILIVPLVGGIAWLVAGRPRRERRTGVPWPSTPAAGFPEYERPRQHILGPEDDPAFLEQMRRSNAEQEDLLRRWEDDLRRRERELDQKRELDEKKDGGPTGEPS